MSDVKIERNDRGVALKSGELEVTVHENRGTFDVTSGGRAVLSDAAVAVHLYEGPTFSTRGGGVSLEIERPVRDELGTGVEAVFQREADEHEPEVTFSVAVYEGYPFAVLRCEVTNRGRAPVRIQAFRVLDGGRVDLGSAPQDWRIYEEGWQNWSVAAVLPVSGEDMYMAPPVVGPTTQPPQQDGRFVAEMMGAVVDPQTGVGLVAGFVTTADQFSQVWLDRGGPKLTAGSYADGVTVRPGGRLASERLLIEPTRSPLRSIEGYGDALAAAMHAVPWPDTVAGWCSWYYYWQGVSEEAVLANLDYLSEHSRELPLGLVQVDDGYQAGIGDWLTPNEKFPHGMGWIADRIHERGFKAGLWLAPFMIGANSQLWKDHPDWAVQHKPGRPYVAMINWAQECYAMDLTRPEVMEWLENVFQTVFNKWKYDYIKIDFLYAGAVDGIRHDPDVTRAQAYRRAIEKIREIAGERFILGCGHPIGPSIGLVNGSRIGPDVAPFWYPAEPPREAGRNDLSTVSTFNAVRQTITRYWMHNRLWLNDPDCLLARETDTALTPDEIRTLTTVIVLSGGMMLDSDNLPRLSDTGRELASMVLPVFGRPAVPLDLFQSQTPQLFELDCGTHRMLGVFNWGDEERGTKVSLPAENSHVFDVWRREYLGVLRGETELGVPRHGCRLLAIRPAQGRPQVIGSTFHLLQGALEVAAEEWAVDGLRVSLRPVAKANGELFIHVPDEFGTPMAVGATFSQRANGAWAAALTVDGDTALEVSFQR